MTHAEKLRMLHEGAMSLHVALEADILHPAKQLHACIGCVKALSEDLERHLHLHGLMVSPAFDVMRNVAALGEV